MLKKALSVLALAGAMASAHSATVLINQGFDNVPALTSSGWVITNAGTGGTGLTSAWVQGDQTNFTSQSGAANSYISSNYNNVAPGGTLASWLITPSFSTAANLAISFWVRGATDDAYSDLFAFGFSDGSTSISNFLMSAAVTASQDGWVQYTIYTAGTGLASSARFAIEYLGSADASNVIGLDSLTVTVPEPSTWALVGVSLLGLGAIRRRKAGQR